jgi:hypothetical protein
MAEKAKKSEAFVFAAGYTAASNSFKAAVTAFNKVPMDTNALSKVLDPNVVLYGISTQQIVAQGRNGPNGVVAYLKANLSGCNFAPISTKYQPTTWPISVSGTARWTDNDGSPQDTINYEFTFDTTPAALILTLWAS